MNPETLKAWLRSKKSKGLAGYLLLGVLSLLGGITVLFITFWFTYAVIFLTADGLSALAQMAFDHKFQLNHRGRLICSGVFIVVLFIQHLRTDPSYWGEYPTQEEGLNPGLEANFGAHAPFAAVLSRPRTSAKMIADILLTGPRLILAAGGTVNKAVTLKKLDEEKCANLLALLYSRPDAVAFEELAAAGHEPCLTQIRQLEGVYFLTKGLLLSPDLREELIKFQRGRHAPV